LDKRNKVSLFFVLSMLVSVCLVYLQLRMMDIQKLVNDISKIPFMLVVALIIFNLILFYPLAMRWHILLGRKHFQLQNTLFHYMVSNFFNFFTPSNLGGDAYRLASFRTPDTGTDKLLLLVAFERVLSLILWLLLVVGVLSIDRAIDGQLVDAVAHAFADIASLFLVGATATLLLLSASLAFYFLGRLKKVLSFIRCLMFNTFTFITVKRLILIVTLTLLSVFGWAATFKFVGDCLEVRLGLHIWLLIAIFGELARLLPIAVQGIGVREGTFVFFGMFLGFAAEDFFLIASAGYLILTLAMLISPIISIFHLKLQRLQ